MDFGNVRAPFKGVATETGGVVGYICENSGAGPDVVPAFKDPQTGQPYPNSTILRMAMFYAIFGSSTSPWEEPYAQAFAYEAFDKTIPEPETLQFAYVWVANNGYLKCQTTWANAVLNKASTPPAPPAGFTCQ